MDKVETKKSQVSEPRNILRSDLSMSSKMKSTSRLEASTDVQRMRETLNL